MTDNRERAFKPELNGSPPETPATLNLSVKVCRSCGSTGPGYRVYFKQRGRELIILLAGGDKSTQAKDIKAALRLARNLSE